MVLHQNVSLMSMNISQAVTIRTKLPVAPPGLWEFRKVGKISSVLRVNISRKHLQTFLTFYSQYHSVMIAAKLSPFLNKAPVKEHYSLTTQQQSSAGRRIRPVTTISPLANHGQDTLWLSRRTMGFLTPALPAGGRRTWLVFSLCIGPQCSLQTASQCQGCIRAGIPPCAHY